MTTPKQAEVAQRRNRALELRAAGLTYELIAQQLGYSSRQSAHRDVQAAIEQSVELPTREMLNEELNRLDKMMQGVWAEARKGDPNKVNAVLKIMDARARYLGLYAPERLQAEVRIDDPTKVAESILEIADSLKAGDAAK